MKKLAFGILLTLIAISISLIIYVRNKIVTDTDALTTGQTINTSSELIKEGKSKKAEALLQKKLQSEGENHLLYFNLGITKMKQKKYQEAATAFTKAIELEPTQGAYINRAYCLKILNKREDAIADYTALIENYPAYKRALIERGRLYIISGKKDKARADLLNAKEAGLKQAESLLKTIDDL